MNQNPTLDDVRGAVEQARSGMVDELDTFGLKVYPDRLSPSYGGWLLPAECHGSAALRKSYELHKLVEKLEDRIQDLARTTVTVDLLATANKNGD